MWYHIQAECVEHTRVMMCIVLYIRGTVWSIVAMTVSWDDSTKDVMNVWYDSVVEYRCMDVLHDAVCDR